MTTNHLILLAALFGFVSSSYDCHACLDGYCHSKIAILEDHNFSGQLAIDRTENTLYFHYTDHNIDRTAAFYLNDIRLQILPNIDFSFAKTVDQSNRDLYFGAARGIYKYNPISNNTIEFGLSDKTIWRMQFKNKIYFVLLKTKGLFTFENRKSKTVPLLSNYTIDDFVIDYKEDVYFLSESILYRLKKGAKQVTVVANDVYSITTDKNENVHFVNSVKKGLYQIDWKTGELMEVGAIGTNLPLRCVFDSYNNLIYTHNNSKTLYYFMSNYGRCIVSKRSHGRKAVLRLGREDNEIQSELVIERVTNRTLALG